MHFVFLDFFLNGIAVLDRNQNVSEYGVLRHIILGTVRRLGVYQTQRIRNWTSFCIRFTTHFHPWKELTSSLWATKKFQLQYIRIIIIIGIQPLGRSGQRPEFGQATGMALVRCILGKFLGVACHCFPPLFRCSHFSPPGASTSATTWEIPAALSGNCRWECCPVILPKMTTSMPFRDLLHEANVRHGTDGFTYPPKEGVLRIFLPLKIRRLRPGLNPRTRVLKASTLPLNHRSRYCCV